jgi:hypothetical protein
MKHGFVLTAALAACWAILFLALPPAAQEFPLNDDWAFGRGALLFAQGEGPHYFKWASMPLLGQWLWAWPFVEVLGPSHVALRVSTIVLSFLGVLAFFDLLRQSGVSSVRASFVAACFAFNPIYFELSGTFLTDVPALAFSLVALALYGRAFCRLAENGPGGWLLLALAVGAALLGATTRQNAITVPVTAAILMLRFPQLWRRPFCWLALALPAGAAFAAHYWLKTRPDYYPLISRELPHFPWVNADLGRLVLLAFTMTHYLGLSTLPVLLLDADPHAWRKPAIVTGFSVVFLLITAGAIFYGFHDEAENVLRDCWDGSSTDHNFLALFQEPTEAADRFPYLGNMLTPWGFDREGLFVGQRPLLLGHVSALTLTVVGCVAGAGLLVRAACNLRAGGWKNPLFPFALLHLPFLLIPWVLFDRYLIVFMPAALLLAMRPLREQQGAYAPRSPVGRILAVATLLLFAVFSLGLLHDWLAWNSARWAVGRRALDRGFAAQDMDGGFEWNSWHAAASVGHNRGRYALSFSILPGSKVLDQEPYRLWLIPGRRAFYFLDQRPIEGP